MERWNCERRGAEEREEYGRELSFVPYNILDYLKKYLGEKRKKPVPEKKKKKRGCSRREKNGNGLGI